MITLSVELGYSRSAKYPDAVRLMQRLPHYCCVGNDKEIVHSAKYSYSEINSKRHVHNELVSMASSWKVFTVRIQDRILKPNQMYLEGTDSYRSIESVLKCEDTIHKVANRSEYCRSRLDEPYWPCKHLSYVMLSYKNQEPERYWGQNKYWWHFGSIDRDLWIIDKDELRNRIDDNLRDKGIEFCPLINQEAIAQVIDSLPDVIDPVNDANWRFQTEKNVIAGQTVEVRTGVVPSDFPIRDYSSPNVVRISFPLSSDESDSEQPSHELKTAEIPEETYDDIGGLQTQKSKIRETVELPFDHPEVYQHLGIKPHSGILLYGPPGNGKTMLAKAIANSLRAGFFLINGPELSTKWYGETEEKLRKIFSSARKMERSVIYFDEIDAIAKTRSDDSTGGRIDSKVLTQLLTEMDGVVGSTSKVLCIGSTNRIEFIDSAILRPGRLDFHLLIPNPDEQARMTLFELFLGRMPVDSSITYDTLVEKTTGYSAAEIEFICKESGLNSLKRVYQITDLLKSSDPIDMSKVVVTMQDVLLAFDNKSLQRYKS